MKIAQLVLGLRIYKRYGAEEDSEGSAKLLRDCATKEEIVVDLEMTLAKLKHCCNEI